MSKRKRILALLLSMVFMITAWDSTAFASTSDSAVDTAEPMIYVESMTAKEGSTIDVNVKVKGNPGILGAMLGFTYDDNLTLLSAMQGDAFSSLTMTKPGKLQSPCQFIWDGQSLSEEDIKDGVILTLSFKVDENVKKGSVLGINVTAKYGDVVDQDLNSLKVQLQSGKVSVSSYTPGDLNEDGNINTTDVILLRRHIAGGYNITINENAADVNGDGEKNATDVIMIRRYIAGGYGIQLVGSPDKDNQCRHSMQLTEEKEATCTEDGNSKYYTCSVCGKYFTDEEGTAETAVEDTVIPAKGHTEVIDPAVEATDIATGLTEGSHCSVCNTVIRKQEEIPMLSTEHYNITYNLDNNDSYLQQVEIVNNNPAYYTTEKGLKLANLKVPGYIFDGWYDGAGKNGTLVKEIKAGETGDIELYARWSKVEYTVQFDSPLAPVEDITYTVDKGVTLSNPSWFGYTFVGWSDDDANIVTSIKKGTTGNITLHANWTSKRNQTIPVSSLGDPIIEEDEKNGQYLFAYEIGRIENVPLYTIKDFGNSSGITVSEEFTTSGSISENSASTIADMVSNATTRSDSWTLSEEWNDSTTVSEEHSSEVGSEVIKSATQAYAESGKWNISRGDGGTKSTTVSDKTSSGWSNTISAKISGKYSSEVGAGADLSSLGIPLNVSTKTGFEIGGEIGGSGTQTGSTEHEETTVDTSTWNTNLGYEGSKSSSGSSSLTSSLSQKISDKKGYSQTKSHNTANSSTSAIATSQTTSREYASSLSYATAKTDTEVKKYSNENAPEGYYRLVCAGTLHVFAVVGYDISTNSYYTYTYNVLDDEVKDFVDYSKTTSGFDDYENGVLPFDVPYYVNEYISNVIGRTDGLVVDTDTGKIVKYTGEAKNVVIPRYMAIDDGSDKKEVVKITGFSANAFSGNETIKSVKLPDTVTQIPDRAFEGCTALERVSGGTITEIGEQAFKGCSALSDYTVKQTVERVGANAFDDVKKIVAKAATGEVAEAVIASGARSITLDLASMEGEFNHKILSVPDGTEYFKISGAGRTYKNIRIKSEAETTVIAGMNFENESGIPLKISSPNVTLNKVTATAKNLALVLSAKDTTLSLYGAVAVKSEGANAMLCKNTNLVWEKENAVGTLNVTGNLMVCGEISGQDNLNISEGKVITVSAESFDQMMQESLEWVPASEVPDNAVIVAEKWKYKETTKITSSQSVVDGYTLYDTTSTWGAWGGWSGWRDSSVSGSDSREVQTQKVAASYKTQYNYSRWASKSNNTGNLGPVKGTWGGVYCQYYFEKGWSDSALSVSGTQYSNQVGGNFNLYGNNQWFNQKTKQVVASYKTQWRYRDRSKIYTYYHKKVEDKESATEVSESDSISDVQKWVQYVE